MVIVVYASSTIALGWYYSRKQKDSREYFIGSGSLNPVLVGVSLFATHLSTISYLSVPGETISKGPIMILLIIPCYPVSYFIVRRYLLSVYMRHRVTSAYELLEDRLGLGVRLLGAGMFVVVRLSWMCLLVYVAARAMTVMLGVSEEWIPWIVLVTGFVSIIYTSLGGLGAVVITDFLQTALLLGGAIVVIVLVTVELGDFSWIPTSWQPTWDSQPAFSFDPRVRVTMFGTFFSVLVWTVCTAGGDQLSIQRFMSTGDAEAAKRAYLAQTLVASAVLLTLLFVGFALMGYFQARPDELPSGLNLATDGDRIFPRFIAFHLPIGIAGLVVSAMLAAAMSSLDSGVNSITAVVTTDFLERFGLMPKTRKGYVRLAQCLAFGLGAVVVVGSSYMGNVPGNITGMTQRTTNLLATPAFSLFFFALFCRFGKPAGAVVGAVYGITVGALIAFSGNFYGLLQDSAFLGSSGAIDISPISFQWISPLSLLVNLAAGAALSKAIRTEDSRGRIAVKSILALLPLFPVVALILGWPWIVAG
jgi:SSS family solute:Na+ symporter